jgi:ABC-type sugar transport system ATPase subunit
MTVEANLGFPLKMRRVPRDEIARAVAEVAQLLDLGNYLARYPEHLSGGQRQRVALGRAIIRQPVAFLMDEPLSNLDALLRVQMRSELLKLHRRVGRATLYVTHDQIEAMTMADRIVVMKSGVVQQVGRPDEVYGTPANTFVATFVGSPPMNLFEGRTEVLDGARRFVGEIEVPLDGRWGDVPPGKAVLGIRPEKIELIPPDEADSTKGTVELVEDVGAEDIISVNIGTRSCLVRVPTHGTVRERDTVGVRLPAGSLHLFDADGQRIGPRRA